MTKSKESRPANNRVPATDGYQPLQRGYQPKGSSEIPTATPIHSNVVLPATPAATPTVVAAKPEPKP
jgi:hypothetical protein